MIIAVGSLVYVRSLFGTYDELCVILTKGRPEFIGEPCVHYYYDVYSFTTRERFLAFDYEMIFFDVNDYSEDLE